MLDLTRQEKIILLFLTLAFVAGSGISYYKKTHSALKLEIQPKEFALRRIQADKFTEQERLVNINSSRTAELKRLPGVGETIAAEIIAYREAHGPFESKQQLLQVKGIGEKKFIQIKGLISIK